MDILIIGSGLSSAVIAHEWAKKGKQVHILEKRNNLAGNIYDKKMNGSTIHLYGPHIFHTDDEKVNTYMNNFWTLNEYKNVVRAKVLDKEVPIPFNWESLKAFWPNDFEEIKGKLIKKYGENKRVFVAELMADKDEQLKEVANFIFSNVFLNYTIKMWDKKPEEIDPSVMARVPMLVTGNQTRYFSNKYEGIPKEGYTATIEKMFDSKNITIEYGVDASKLIEIKDDKVFYKGEELTIPVLYSGPLDELFDYSEGVLKYRSLDIQFETINKKQLQDTAVVNYPAHPEFTRICEYKHFNYESPAKTTISKEYPGWFKLNDKRWNEPFYPFANDQSRLQYNIYFDKVKGAKNFFPIGRLATYKYINMDETIAIALELLEKIDNV